IGKLSALTKRMSRDDLLAKLEAVGVPAGPINNLGQVFVDPQVAHRGMRIEPRSTAAKGGKIPGVRTPVMIDGVPMAAETPCPRLGEHTEEILREIGEALFSACHHRAGAKRRDPVIPFNLAQPCHSKRDGRDRPGHDKTRYCGAPKTQMPGVYRAFGA